MVKLDIQSFPQNEQYLADFLSDDSDTEEGDAFLKKCNEIEPLVKLDETFPCSVMVLGIPHVPEEKFEKLKNVLRRIFGDTLSKKGLPVTNFEIDILQNDPNVQIGICFLTFQRSLEAKSAAKLLNQLSIDSHHTCQTCLVDKVDAAAYHDEAFYSPNRTLGFTRENLRWWLTDDKCREQFFIRYEDKTDVFWHDHLEYDPILLYSKNYSADMQPASTGARIQWSPQGSYLAFFHNSGVSLVGESTFEEKMFFEHPNANQIKFSPNEEYILTWTTGAHTSQTTSLRSVEQQNVVRIWKVITGELITVLQPQDFTRGPVQPTFPSILFSHDDSYIAYLMDEMLYIFSLPSMELITDDKNRRASLKHTLNRFAWSPADNIISIWTPETTNTPGRLLLVEVPSLKELASKNIYNVHEAATMHWQPRGKYLALRVLIAKKTGKKAKKTFTQLEIFSLKEKNIPVDIVQIENASVKQLQWEDGDSKRFVLVVENENMQQSLRFYNVSYSEQGYSDVILAETFDIASQINFLKWSPQGTNFILASKHSEASSRAIDYSLMFCALSDNDKVEVMHKDEHFFVNDLLWSNCGRYLSTVASAPLSHQPNYRNSSDLGFIIWNFQGRKLYNSNISQLYQFMWRPNPPLSSSTKKIEEIKRSLNHYSKRFDAIDERIRATQREAILKKRQKQSEEFNNILNELEHWRIAHRDYYEWLDAAAMFDKSLEWESYTTVTEKEIESIEQVIGKN